MKRAKQEIDASECKKHVMKSHLKSLALNALHRGGMSHGPQGEFRGGSRKKYGVVKEVFGR